MVTVRCPLASLPTSSLQCESVNCNLLSPQSDGVSVCVDYVCVCGSCCRWVADYSPHSQTVCVDGALPSCQSAHFLVAVRGVSIHCSLIVPTVRRRVGVLIVCVCVVLVAGGDRLLTVHTVRRCVLTVRCLLASLPTSSLLCEGVHPL